MFSSIMDLIYDVFASCSVWFGVIFSSMGATGFFLGMLFIVMAVRYLLGPLFGAGSDRAKKKETDGDS